MHASSGCKSPKSHVYAENIQLISHQQINKKIFTRNSKSLNNIQTLTHILFMCFDVMDLRSMVIFFKFYFRFFFLYERRAIFCLHIFRP